MKGGKPVRPGQLEKRAKSAIKKMDSGLGAGLKEGDARQKDFPTKGPAKQAFDRAVADAVVASAGQTTAVLRTMGLNPGNMTGREKKRVLIKITMRPGVRRILDERFSDIDAQWNHIMARMVSIARFGDASNAIAAAWFVGKAAGKFKEPSRDTQVNINFGDIIRDPKFGKEGAQQVIDDLDHEPGDPVPVFSEARAKALKP